ncbi:hypothetical protein KCU79_g10, partial [Aureobasidium melanogenum]
MRNDIYLRGSTSFVISRARVSSHATKFYAEAAPIPRDRISPGPEAEVANARRNEKLGSTTSAAVATLKGNTRDLGGLGTRDHFVGRAYPWAPCFRVRSGRISGLFCAEYPDHGPDGLGSLL